MSKRSDLNEWEVPEESRRVVRKQSSSRRTFRTIAATLIAAGLLTSALFYSMGFPYLDVFGATVFVAVVAVMIEELVLRGP